MKDLKMVDTLTEEDTVLDDNMTPVPPAVLALHNNMIKALRKVYPAFKDYWHITVNTEGGIVQIRNLAISGEFGIQLKIVDIDPEMRLVRRLAGELLERFNVARAKGISIQRAMQDVKSDGTKLIHEE